MTPEERQKLSEDLEALKIKVALSDQSQTFMKETMAGIKQDVAGVKEDISEIKELITGGKGAWKAITVMVGVAGAVLTYLGYGLFEKIWSKL